MSEEKKNEGLSATKTVVGTEELNAEIISEEKTVKTENGKELNFKFVDTGDREKENKEAAEAGVEGQALSKEFTEKENFVKETKMFMHSVDGFMNHVAQDMTRMNVELSAVVTCLLRRGLVTKKELDESLKAVNEQMAAQMEKMQPEDDKTEEIIKKPSTGHGDNGLAKK